MERELRILEEGRPSPSCKNIRDFFFFFLSLGLDVSLGGELLGHWT